MYSVIDLFYTNLTPYTTFEAWVTRTCLVLAALCIIPSLGLIFADLFIWLFRAGESPAKSLLKRSRSGLGLVHQAVTSRKSSSQERKGVSSSGFKMTPTSAKEEKTSASKANESAVKIVREDTDPLGGVGNKDASEIKLGRVVG